MKRITGIILLSLIGIAQVLGQSTAFTYQGSLNDAGTPADGLHDLRFRLFDGASGGAQVGATQCINNVDVVDGLFTVQLDFGQQFASVNPRFLDIQVRRDIGQPCTDDFGFVLLSPRQPLAATPRALAANVANALAAPDGSPANAVFVDNAGLVGIGTTTPGQPLHIANATTPSILLQDTGANSTQTGYLDFRNASGVETGWLGFAYGEGNPDFGIVTVRPSGDINIANFGSGGNVNLLPAAGAGVGIGTTTPAAMLDVRGDIRLGPVGQYRAPAGEENLRIIRGTVSHSGTALRGSGFTVQKIDEGKYTVTFTTPFSAIPTVTATGTRDSGNFVVTANIDAQASITTSQVTIVTWDHDFGDFYDSRFDFIAIGPR